MSDKIKSLYDQLTDDGYDTGDLNTFSANIKETRTKHRSFTTT